MMQKPELLAPAGSPEALRAAVGAGADAVYFGGSAFSARAFAKNIADDAVADAVEFAHLRGVRLYAAINTMLTDAELPAALEYAAALYGKGVDAAIVADAGLAAELKRQLPALELHASTQLCIHSLGGLSALKALGISRAVLSRELSAAAIDALAGHGVELEVFVHGAMCSGVSGVCLLSSAAGARSGNRGSCAQPCRMRYSLCGSEAYHLSMSELCLLDCPRLLKSASALKIEGRMRRPEYVALAVSAYRAVIDGRGDIPALKAELNAMFNRGGFTRGYIGGGDVTYTARPNNTGVYIGKVVSVKNGRATIDASENGAGVSPLIKGDGLEFIGRRSHGGLLIGYADDAGKRRVTVPAPKDARAGDAVYRTTDARLMEKLRARLDADDRLPARVTLRLAEGEPPILTVASGVAVVMASGSEPTERALSPVNAERLRGYAQKSGELFRVESCEVELTGQPFISAASVNALRREAFSALKEALLEVYEKSARREALPLALPERALPAAHCEKPALWALVSLPEQAEAAFAAGADGVYLLPREWSDSVLSYAQKYNEQNRNFPRKRLMLALPPFILDGEGLLARLPENTGALCGSIGQLAALAGTRTLHADYTLNIASSASAEVAARLGAEEAALSAEIALGAMARVSGIRRQAVVYGRLRAMQLMHCPLKKAGGCDGAACLRETLTDTDGAELAFCSSRTATVCHLCLLAPTVAYGDIPALRRAGIESVRAELCLESAEEVARITGAYRRAIDDNARADVCGRRTHIERGVD